MAPAPRMPPHPAPGSRRIPSFQCLANAPMLEQRQGQVVYRVPGRITHFVQQQVLVLHNAAQASVSCGCQNQAMERPVQCPHALMGFFITKLIDTRPPLNAPPFKSSDRIQ